MTTKQASTRERVARLLRGTRAVFTVEEASRVLSLPRDKAARVLARWTKAGRLARVRRGLYIPVPLASVAADAVPDDPWSVAEVTFRPCYVGGWSAAEYWGLTEQLFRTIVVFTTSPPRQRRLTIAGTEYWTIGTRDDRMFGLRSVWRDQIKIPVSDPGRTVVDILANPAIGGGLRHSADVLQSYLSTATEDDRLIDYATMYGNGAVFKRLGFLTETLSPGREVLIHGCRRNLSAGLAKLDPALDCDRIVKRWRLRVPARWAGA